MSTEIERLEAEIAQRDARIADLEAQAGDGTSSNKYRAELYDEVWQAARDMGYGNVTGALQELAALKAQQPSAGVVDERAAELARHLRCAHDFIENTDAFGAAAANGVMECGGAIWDIDASKASLGQLQALTSQQYGGVVHALMSALESVVHDERVPNAVSQECAAVLIEARRLNPNPTGAGVVLPERANENEGNSYSVMQAMARNQTIDEVARLNHCRAQAVPDGWIKGFKLHEIEKALDDGLPRPNYWAETCDGEPAVHTKLWRGLPGSASFYDSRFWPLYGADMLAAAPSAKQEG